MFFLIKIRLDITFVILIISFFAKNLDYNYYKTIKQNLKNEKSVKQYYITYNRQKKVFVKKISYFN